MSSRRSVLRQLASAFEAAALTAVAGLLFSGYYGENGWQAPILGAAAGGAAVAWAGRLWRRGTAVVAAAVVVGGLVAAAALILPNALDAGTGAGEIVRTVLDAPLHGWSRMLTVGVPAPVTAALLVLPVALSWAASLTSATLALSGRTVLAPLLPPSLFFVVGLMLTAGQQRSRFGLTTAFLAIALLGGFLRAAATDAGHQHSTDDGSRSAANVVDDGEQEQPVRANLRRWGQRGGGRPRLGQTSLGIPLVAMTGALAIIVAAAVPAHGRRYGPAPLSIPQVQTVQMLNPLVTLKSQLTEKTPVPEFTVRITGALPHDVLRLRVAALDDFDGVTWTTTGHFTRPAAKLPVPPDSTAHATSVSLDITIDKLDGTLLPVVGQPTALHAQDAEVDPPTGAVTVPTLTSLRGYHYRVTGLVPSVDAGLRTALPDAAGDNQSTLTLDPAPPTSVTEQAKALTASAATPYQRAAALETALRGLPYSTVRPPQESYAAVVATAISGTKQVAGFAEQHASAFAVMARSVSLPTRVAVGYEIPKNRVTAGPIAVTSADINAWDEVYFKGYGWVPFEPTTVGQTAPVLQPQSTGTTTQDNNNAGGNAVVVGLPATATASAAGLPMWAELVLVLLVLLLVTGTGVFIAKSRRRQRRHRGESAARRVLGAWAEAVDQLVEAGMTPDRSLSPTEVRDQVLDRLGPRAGGVVATLTPLVDEAAFSAGAMDEALALLAWQYEGQLADELRRRHPFSARWRRHLDPRPLLRRTTHSSTRVRRTWRLPGQPEKPTP